MKDIKPFREYPDFEKTKQLVQQFLERENTISHPKEEEAFGKLVYVYTLIRDTNSITMMPRRLPSITANYPGLKPGEVRNHLLYLLAPDEKQAAYLFMEYLKERMEKDARLLINIHKTYLSRSEGSV